MVSQTVTVNLERGLHARPASGFVALASSFQSNITLIHGEKEGDPKSIIHLLTLAVHKGATIELRAEGPDEEQAVQALCAFVRAKDEDKL